MSSDAEMESGPSQSKPKVRFGKDKLAYDPDQDPEEKRQVRRQYRELHKNYEGADSILLGVCDCNS